MTTPSKQTAKRKSATSPVSGRKMKTPAKRVTKRNQLIEMLSADSGTDVATISKKLGWQAHTTRAALTGLRKAGYGIAANKPDGGKPSRYRITAEPQVADAGKA